MTLPPASLRSIKSARSMRSGSYKPKSYLSEDCLADFGSFLTESCKKFGCPVDVVVAKLYQRETTRSQKTRESRSKSKRMNVIDDPDATSTGTTKGNNTLAESVGEDVLVVTAVHDSMNHLVELIINKYRDQILPKMILQLMRLALPYFQQLTKFTIKNTRVDVYTMYELSKILPISTITEVCLDECPLMEANYDILLNNTSNLNHLSLCRCKINDVVFETIASRLCYSEPAERHLFALNLSSNQITDEGAKHLAEALRSNRCLRYLNLADNLLSDNGANHIFDVLKEFHLTHDENMDRRHRYMLYLKKKRTIYLECLQKFCAKSSTDLITSAKKQPIHNKRVSRSKSRDSKESKSSKINVHGVKKEKKNLSPNDESMTLKAEMMATELLGPFVDPFSSSSLRIEDGYPYCIGNLTLCYLNLAYNDLTYASIMKLLKVVEYQHINSNPPFCGLINVILDGNYLPAVSTELESIHNILNQQIKCFNKQHLFDRVTSGRRSALDKRNALSK